MSHASSACRLTAGAFDSLFGAGPFNVGGMRSSAPLRRGRRSSLSPAGLFLKSAYGSPLDRGVRQSSIEPALELLDRETANHHHLRTNSHTSKTVTITKPMASMLFMTVA